MALPRDLLRSALLLAGFASAWACNSILDIPPGRLVPAAPTCVLNSDCPTSGEVCLFRVCSQPCREDKDCGNGSRCLTADNGTACVASGNAQCESDADCEGASCASGVCRAPCDSDADCLAGQTCSQSLCFGTDANHDAPLASAGTGAVGGSSNANGGSATLGGIPGAEGGAGGEMGPVRECETSATRCNDSGQRETCNADGMWATPVTCPFVCVGDDCGGECVPKSKDCVQGVTPRECSDAGQWQPKADCPAVCVDGACQATCQKGDRQCSGKDVMVCSDLGKFEKDQTCPFLCDPATKTCTGECVPASQQCNKDELQSCGADALWQKLASCPALCTAVAGMPGKFECSGDCKPTTKRCQNTSTLQTCNSQGQYDDTNCATSSKTCFVQNTVAGCYGSCAPGQQKCVSNKVQACTNLGAYADSQTCTNQTCVQTGSSASCVGSCAPGQQQCKSNRVQTCNASGEYADSSNCTNLSKTCVASGSTATCSGSCGPGDVSCISNDAYACEGAGTYKLSDDCAAPDEICNSGACIPNDPYAVGNDNASGWANYDVPNDTWHLVKITPPNDATVIALRVIGRSTNGLMRMGLWKDKNGAPDAFVAQTDSTNMAAGPVSDAPVPLNTKVVGGQVYWVGAKFTGSAQIYQKSVAGQLVYTYSQSFGTVPSSLNPFPAGSSGSFNNMTLNLYLVVQDESL